jgi:hypothetical protein
MTEWMDEFGESFFLTVGGLVIGLLGLTFKLCFQSKCKDINLCCGLINCSRDVVMEEKIQEYEIDHNKTPSNGDV